MKKGLLNINFDEEGIYQRLKSDLLEELNTRFFGNKQGCYEGGLKSLLN